MPPDPEQKIPILMVSYYYPPVGGVRVLRTTKIGKYLSRMGFLPVVLCSKEEILPASRDEELDSFQRILICLPKIKLPSRQTKKAPRQGVDLNSSPKPLPPLKKAIILLLRAIKQFILYPDIAVAWIPSAYKAGLSAIRKYGIRAIYATHPPPSNLIVALLLALRTKKPLVVDFRDFWRYYPFRVKFHPLELLLTPWLEKYLIKKSALVIAVTAPLVRTFLSDHRPYLSPKLLYLPNGYDEEDFVSARPTKKDPAGRFRLVHTGGFYEGRGGSCFLAGLERAIQLFPELEKVMVFRQVGFVDITEQEHIQRLVERGVVELIPPVSHSQAVREMLGADLLLLIVPPKRAGEAVLSLKSTEYIRAEKPILAISPPSPTTVLVEEFGAGRCIDNDDVEGIAEAIISFYKKRKKRNFVDLSALSWYERNNQVARLAEILWKMLGGYERVN
jgi:glycosyltransferase involved in cell wall biosynthesis